MSGSTGTPMNLNTFDGTDDVVKALTDLFNQNMNLINSGDIHTKVWKPNTAYQKNDILVHPYHNSLMYALSSHTSSNSTTEVDWSTNDGTKWQNISYAPVIANWMANMNYNVGDLLMDGLELKQATTAGSTATLDRTRSAFVGSRVANWTPNTKYNVGDIVLLASLNADSTANGRILNGLLICNTAHTSGTIFPASSEGTWTLLNQDSSYTLTRSITVAYHVGAYVVRIGKQVSFSIVTANHDNIPNTGQSWKSLPDKIADEFKVASTMRIELYGGPAMDSNCTFEISGTGMRFGTRQAINNGSWLHGQENYQTDAAPLWAAATPL